MQKITPFLWYEKDALAVANYYKSIFGENVIIQDEDKLSNTPSGEVQIVTISIFGLNFRLMSAGPFRNFNEAISFEVRCKNQAEVDKYWTALTSDGGEEGQCGWLKDKYGVSWQIVPVQLGQFLGNPDSKKAGLAMQAMLKMKKLVIKDLEEATK